jgi:AcrR family transcriptional regulator
VPAQPSATTEIRDQILAHATRLFAARGFDGTPIQEIADAVGIRKPSLLYHFPSKDDLRRAVLDHILARWNRILPSVLRAAASGGDQFDGVVAEVVSFFADDRDRARVLLREILDRPAEVRALLSTHVTPWIEVVAGHIRRGQGHGDVHAGVDPEVYVVHIIELVLASLAVYDLVSDHFDFDRYLGELLRLAKSSLFIKQDNR